MRIDEYEEFFYVDDSNQQLFEEMMTLQNEYKSLKIDYLTKCEIEQKLTEKLHIAETPQHNQRGAGRKATTEKRHIEFIALLLNNDFKLVEIVKVLNDCTKRCWTHSSVSYIRNRYLKITESGLWYVK